jgi:hypothetical protein
VPSNHLGPDRHARGSRSLLEPGDHGVDVPIVCSITRFHLRSARHLLPAYREYHRVIREARDAQTPGLLRCAFLVENPVTWYSLSIWSERNAIAHFGTNVPRHVEAARAFFPRLASFPTPELWSTKWRLDSVSNNLDWGDFDMRGAILRASE